MAVKARKDSWIVYVIECGDFRKVGISGDIRKRMRAMALHNPHPLKCRMYRYVPKGRSRLIEMAVHAALAEWACGREWFSAPIEKIREVLDAKIAADKARNGGWSSTFDVSNEFSSLADMMSNSGRSVEAYRR